MALFDNVTYTYYSDTLGRAEVPNETEFNKYKTVNMLALKAMYSDGILLEREPNGIDSACCMMIECDYVAAQTAAGASNLDASETIGGYSHSINTKAADKTIELNAESTGAKKLKWLRLYCEVMNGGR